MCLVFFVVFPAAPTFPRPATAPVSSRNYHRRDGLLRLPEGGTGPVGATAGVGVGVGVGAALFLSYAIAVDGLADGLGFQRADLVPDGLAFLLRLALLIEDDLALGDLEGHALGLQDQLAFLRVLCLAALVGDPLARSVFRVPAFRVVVDGLALLLPDVVVDNVAAVLAGLVAGDLRLPGISGVRFPAIILLVLVLLVLLVVGGGHGGAEQEGEEGRRGLHCVVVGVRRKNSSDRTWSAPFIAGAREVLFPS